MNSFHFILFQKIQCWTQFSIYGTKGLFVRVYTHTRAHELSVSTPQYYFKYNIHNRKTCKNFDHTIKYIQLTFKRHSFIIGYSSVIIRLWANNEMNSFELILKMPYTSVMHFFKEIFQVFLRIRLSIQYRKSLLLWIICINLNHFPNQMIFLPKLKIYWM